MILKYLAIFFVSMVPLIELRAAVPIAIGMGLPTLPVFVLCILFPQIVTWLPGHMIG